MEPADLLVAARRSAGLSQDELAKRAGTSRPDAPSSTSTATLPHPADDRTDPGAAGFTLKAVPITTFTEQRDERGCPILNLRAAIRLEPAHRDHQRPAA